MKKLILLAAILYSCNEPPRHQYKYQIWVYAPISVAHHCDSFKHVGNTWELYTNGKLTESITTIQTVTVEPDPNN